MTETRNIKINRAIGIITIIGCLLYDLYLWYQFSNNSFYHLKPNTFYFAPPSPLPYFIIVLFYSLSALLAGILLIRRKKVCLHFYHLLFIGLFILNTERLIFTYYADDIYRILGNIFSILISILGLFYFNGKEIKKYLGVNKLNRLKSYSTYALISVILLIIFKINVW